MARTHEPVAVLGIGVMGHGMAASALRAGIPTIVWNRRREATRDLAELGAEVAETAADAARRGAASPDRAHDGDRRRCRHFDRPGPGDARGSAGGAARLHEEGADLAPGRELGHFRVRRSPLKALHRVEKPGQDLDVPAG
jgi:threonine dehydrogenase-like Zn-dependent dehydrogenase